jgi:hypothetical protein
MTGSTRKLIAAEAVRKSAQTIVTRTMRWNVVLLIT